MATVLVRCLLTGTKYLTKHVREKRVYLAHSEEQSIMAGKAWQQECEAARDIAAMSVMDAGLSSFLLNQSGLLVH